MCEYRSSSPVIFEDWISLTRSVAPLAITAGWYSTVCTWA